MSFPNPPVPNQEHTHTNGITYIYSDTKKAWEIKYEAAVNTASLPLVSPSSRYLPSAGASLPDSGGLLTQSDYNQWAFNSLVKVDETSRVDAGESAPGDADTNQLWYKPSTGSLYVYYNDGTSSQWVEIGGSSTGELQNLESVLTEGNAADKTILLSDGTDALVSLLPDEASIIVASDTDKKNPRVRLTHIDDLGYPNSQMQMELDGDGTRVDFEFLQAIQSAHFNFDGSDKFVLNKDGDAEFIGKVKAAPAEDGAELSTLSQVLGYVQGLQAEIDRIQNSHDMGEWTYSSTDQYQDPGYYTIRHLQTQEEYDKTIENLQHGLNECLAANSADPSAMSQCQRDYDAAVALVPAVGTKFVTNEWHQGEEIEFAHTDQNTTIHSFENVKVGQYIDMVNEDGSGFMLGEITAVNFGMWYVNDYITYKVIKSSGIAQGKAVVKIFSVADGITGDDLTNFVRKDGDKMTGALSLDGDGQQAHLRLQRDGVDLAVIENHYDATWLKANTDFKIVGDINGVESQMLKVYKDDIGHDDPADDKPGGIRISNMRDPSHPSDGVSLGYMEDYVANHFSGFTGDYLRLDGGVMSGNLVLGAGSGLYSQEIIKSTRNTGYAFQVRPDDGTATASIHTNGNAVFKHITNDGHINTEEGGWVGGNWGFYNATKGVRFYLEDQSAHFADITRQGVVLQNLMYADNMWTLKVQDASDANSKTLIYGDYSSGLILNEVGELNAKGDINLDGGTINATSGNPVLSGRASLDIRTAADYPVVISSGSSYKKLLSFYGFDANEDDNRAETAYINADGKAHFNTVYANDEELATQAYARGNGMRWQHATHEIAADLVAGEFFISSNNGNIYLHPTSYDGVDVGVGNTATAVTDIKQLGSVHRANGDSAYHITWNQITYNNGANKYVRISKNATHLGDSTTQGEIYRLNIPGFTY